MVVTALTSVNILGHSSEVWNTGALMHAGASGRPAIPLALTFAAIESGAELIHPPPSQWQAGGEYI